MNAPSQLGFGIRADGWTNEEDGSKTTTLYYLCFAFNLFESQFLFDWSCWVISSQDKSSYFISQSSEKILIASIHMEPSWWAGRLARDIVVAGDGVLNEPDQHVIHVWWQK